MNLYFGRTGLLERLSTSVVTAAAAAACGGIQEGRTTVKLQKLKHCMGEKKSVDGRISLLLCLC